MANTQPGPRTDLDLDRFRQLLTEERERLLEDIRKLGEQDQPGEPRPGSTTSELSNYDQHMADQGTELFLREQDMAIRGNLEAELDQVEAAWQKLENGT